MKKKILLYVQIFDCPLNGASLKFISHGKIGVTYILSTTYKNMPLASLKGNPYSLYYGYPNFIYPEPG